MGKLCGVLLGGIVATLITVPAWMKYSWEAKSWEGGPFKYYDLDSASVTNKQKYHLAAERLNNDISKVMNVADLVNFSELAGLECSIHKYNGFPKLESFDDSYYGGSCKYEFGHPIFHDVFRVSFVAQADGTLVNKNFFAGVGWK